MAAQRKSIDCRDYPSDKNCSLKVSGTEEEVLDAAVQHAVSAHGELMLQRPAIITRESVGPLNTRKDAKFQT